VLCTRQRQATATMKFVKKRFMISSCVFVGGSIGGSENRRSCWKGKRRYESSVDDKRDSIIASDLPALLLPPGLIR
jgi:hypothetical protein